MRKSSNALDNLRIATHCPVSWESMAGNDQVRFCSQCELNVYNISGMNSVDAESLIATTEGRLCARFFRREDGTVLTRDCPVGLRALRKRLSKRATAIFATVLSLCGAAFGQTPKKEDATACAQQTRVTRKAAEGTQLTTITGTILDPQGAVIPAATITITNELTNVERTTTANENGSYTFAHLEAGNYSIKLGASYFQALEIRSFEVRPQELINLDVTLPPAFQGVVVGIVDISPRLTIDSEPNGTRIYSGDFLRRLPL